jgi:hypothetical protein
MKYVTERLNTIQNKVNNLPNKGEGNGGTTLNI